MGVNKILLAGTALADGATGSAWQAEIAASVVQTSGDYVLPAGWWRITGTSNVTLQCRPDAGSTWRTIFPSTVGGMIFSDGYNAKLVSSSGTITVYISRLA